MDQGLVCTKEGHDSQPIQGICLNTSCEADQKVSCVTCMTTIHAQCITNFCQTKQFIQKLQQLKQAQSGNEHQIIKLVRELVSKAQCFMKIVQQFSDDVFLNYDKQNQINRIDSILKNQNLLTINDWQQGYKMLNDQSPVASQTTGKLIEQLNQIQRLIDQVTQTQSEQTSVQQTPQITETITLQKSVKQDFPHSKGINGQPIVESDWNTITPQKPCIIKAGHRVMTIALSPNGKYIASAGWGDVNNDNNFSIKIWDPITGNQIGNDMNGHTSCVNQINYSKCGNYIVSGSSDRTIRQWCTSTQQQIGQPICGYYVNVTGVEYTDDQRYIVSCSWDKTIRVWESKTGKELADKQIKHNSYIRCLCLSPTQSHVVFGDDHGILTIWDYEKHQQNGQSLKGHTKCIYSVKYSNDGNYIVSGSNDNTIILWDAISPQQIKSFLGHTCIVSSVNFSPDLRYLISGGGDRTVRIWNRVTGQQIGEALKHHTNYVRSTQFSLDGKYIITGGWDEQIRILVAPIDL